MTIKDLKDLKKLIQLCRQTGVEAIEVDNVKMNLGPANYKPTTRKTASTKNIEQTYAPGGITADTVIPTSTLTDEELLMWSVEGPSNFDQQ